MSWGKNGDEASTFPELLEVALLDDADDRSVNEVFGFVSRCSLEASRQGRDYFVSKGTALAMAVTRERYNVLTGQALATGLFTIAVDPNGKEGFKLIENPRFIHLMTEAQKALNAQRKADNSNKYLTSNARFRDGDQCRYCGIVTTPGDQKSPMGMTYDSRTHHRGQQELKDLVVCCRTCNGVRGDLPTDVADEVLPLRPAPPEPYYSEVSVAFLAGAKRFVAPSEPRPGNSPGTAPSSAPALGRAARPVDHAASVTPTTSDEELPIPANRGSTGSGSPGRVGTGRVGQVREGAGMAGSGQVGNGRGARPRRRGRRGRSARGDS